MTRFVHVMFVCWFAGLSYFIIRTYFVLYFFLHSAQHNLSIAGFKIVSVFIYLPLPPLIATPLTVIDATRPRCCDGWQSEVIAVRCRNTAIVY